MGSKTTQTTLRGIESASNFRGAINPDEIRSRLDPKHVMMYDSLKEAKVIGLDVYYSFYAPRPMLKPRNDNPLLEAVRKKIAEYMATPQYKEIRKTTRLNEEESVKVAVTFMNRLFEAGERECAGSLRR